MILTLRTDKPEAEIGLFDKTGTKLHYHTWHANRQLAKELLTVIRQQLTSQQSDWKHVAGIVVFEGPGSFTGLRIGISTANAIAYANSMPIVAARGDKWIENGLARLRKDENDKLALPHYGAEANITLPKK